MTDISKLITANLTIEQLNDIARQLDKARRKKEKEEEKKAEKRLKIISLLDEAKRSGISAKDILDFLNPAKTTEIKKMGRPRKYERTQISDIKSLEEKTTEPTVVVNPSNNN